MNLLTTLSNSNRTAKIFESYDGTYTVEYFMNNKLIQKTHHMDEYLAEEVADDYIAEAGPNPKLLND
jgi:hypothetical protein